MSSPRQAVTLPIVLTLLAACSSVVPQDDPAVTIASPLAKACASYPISVTPGAGAESEVRAGFARIAPGAEVSFASARGTASLVTNVRLSVGSCPRGRNADAQARHLIDGARDAFRLDPSEWTTTFAPTCDQIAAEGTMVSWTRTSLGGAPVRKDVFNYRLRRAGLSVWVDFVSAFYLPPASAALADDMRGCAKLDPVAAEASLRTSQLPFTTFQYCSATGSGKYEPEPRDAFALGAEYWEWEEDAAGAHLRRSREGSLHVDSANHTPQLIASDANCYRDGENRIGFGLRFDAVSSKLEESKPGIDCVVCAH